MASINKLAVRGIRAFSPDDKEQVVEFYFPVTMIVGRNGCGKTTIIEALRYAVTGAFPPGGTSGKGGQNFVHDPRSVGHATVKASVKLRFVSTSGKDYVVTRAMELTQKKTGVTFKQLDGVLRFTDEATGQTAKNSHKCGELDKQIPILLGISKAVLDNVLFVHQEESSWPLQEGAVLKKRFDEIFDSTRYTKAVDVLRKTEKDLANDIKEIMIELSALDARRDAIRAFRIELSEQQDIEEGLMEDKKNVQAELDALDAKLEHLGAILASVEAVQGDLEDLQREEHRLQTALERQREMLENDLTDRHSLHEIQDMLRDFDEKVARHKEEERAVLDKEQALQSEMEDLRAQEMDLKSEVGKWAAKKEAHELCLKERMAKMQRLADAHSIDLQTVTQLTQGTNVSFLANTVNESLYPTQDDITVSYEVPPEAWAAFKRAVARKEGELRQGLKDFQDRARREDDRLQKDINELGAKIASHDHELSKIATRRGEIAREKPQAVPSYNRLKASEVEAFKKRAEEQAKLRQALSDDPRHKDIPAEIRQLEQKMDVARLKLDEEKRVLETLRETLEATNQIRVLEEECHKELGHLEEAVADEASHFLQFNISSPKLPKESDDTGTKLIAVVEETGNLVASLYDTRNSQLNRDMEELTKRQRAVSEVSALINRSSRALSTCKAQLAQIQSKGVVEEIGTVVAELIKLKCELEPDERDPDTLLRVLDDTVAKVDKNYVTDENVVTRKIADRFIEFLKKQSKRPEGDFCPCCDHPIESKAAFRARLSELFRDDSELLVLNANTQANDLKKLLKSCRQTIQSSMTDLREFIRVNKEIEALEAELATLGVESENARKLVDDQESVVHGLQTEVNELRVLLDSSKRWGEDANRIASKRMKIAQDRITLNVDTPYHDRDLRTVERDVTALADEKDKFANRINELNKEMTALNAKLHEAAKNAENVGNVAKEKEMQFQKQQEDNDRRTALDDEEKRLKEEEGKISDALSPLKLKLRQKEADKQRSRDAHNGEEQSLMSSLNTFTSEVSRLYELATTIDIYAQSDGPTLLERVDAELSAVAANVSSLKDELQRLQPEIARAKRMLKDQEREKAQLEFNISILQDQETIHRLQEAITKKEGELDKIEGHKNAAGKRARAKARKEELQAQKAQLEGRYSEIVDRIRSLKRKLSSPEYKDVPEQHRVATIKKETTKIAADDLKKYEKALDQALLQYHSVKIAEVNKIIRELWTATYKGEDITNIEIMTSMEAGSKAAKSYNYRVSMRKGSGGPDLDMRGRCSAGQRVLASLVIRLALAETFGLNCGCIALDEPTVNLDYNNKKGLAESLAQLVETRSKQKNFQLILITHDEEFVAMMKSELQCHSGFDMPEYYFRVFREQASDGKYFSKIRRVDWDESP